MDSMKLLPVQALSKNHSEQLLTAKTARTAKFLIGFLSALRALGGSQNESLRS